MDEFNPLEEPPPIHRVVVSAEPRRKRRMLTGWAGRPSKPRKSDPVPTAPTARTGSSWGVVLLVAGLAVVSVQGWLLHRARTDLADVGARLDEARNSLGMLWESTKRLDEDKMARLTQLADSIRWVFNYAQGEVRVWEASLATLQEKVDENSRGTVRMVNLRLDGFARADQAQRSRLEMLERQDRTRGSAVEALSRRTLNQEANVHDVATAVASLRGTLDKLDSDLGRLGQRFTASTSQYGQLGRRIDNLAGFADGFRRAGLNGDAVDRQLSSLADEVRRIRMRVDSLRPSSRAVYSSSSRSSSNR